MTELTFTVTEANLCNCLRIAHESGTHEMFASALETLKRLDRADPTVVAALMQARENVIKQYNRQLKPKRKHGRRNQVRNS